MSPQSDFEALNLLQNNANEVLRSASVQEALVSHRHDKWVHEISEASLTMLVLCGATKDVLLQMKSHINILRMRNRRQVLKEHQKPDNSVKHDLTKLKNQILKCLKPLRGMKMKDMPVATDIATECRDSMVVVVDMLRDVRLACTLVLEWVFSYVTDDGKSRNWSFRSMLLCGQGHGKIMSEEVAMEAGGQRVELEVFLVALLRKNFQQTLTQSRRG